MLLPLQLTLFELEYLQNFVISFDQAADFRKNMTDFLASRNQYPALQSQIYLNTASCGVVSQATAQAAQQAYQALLSGGGRQRLSWYDQFEVVRRDVAEWLGAQASEVALLPNCSIASNYVAAALGSKRVLLLESDYSSVTMPWLLHPHQVHYFAAEANGYFDPSHVQRAVEENSIEVLAISHVQYDTGFCADLDTLGQFCRDRGVILVVDATQSLGMIPIDLQLLPVDILMGSGYKWMSAGFGNALLYVREALHQQMNVVALGNNSLDGFPTLRSASQLNFLPRMLEVGHYDFSSFWALQQAVHELRKLTAGAIYKRVMQLTDYLYSQLPEEVKVISDYSVAHRSGITVIAGDIVLEQRLLEQQVVTSARGRGLRLSVHHYNSERDITQCCQAIRFALSG